MRASLQGLTGCVANIETFPRTAEITMFIPVAVEIHLINRLSDQLNEENY